MQELFVKRRIVGFGAQLVAVQPEGRAEIDEDDIGGRVLGEAALRQLQQFGWAQRHRAEERVERHVAFVVQRQRAGQQRLKPYSAERRFFVGQALVFGRARIVAGDDHVDQAIVHRLHQRHAIIFTAQWRRELGEGAIAIDIVLVEHEVVDVDARERLHAAVFRALQ